MKDHHRPIYHFQPPSDWMNDPKLFYWKKEIHLFFQYSPGDNWQLRHWGHAVSKDMLHWKLLPIALTPTPGGPDWNGCYTGSIIADPGNRLGKFHILYTGVSPQVQCLASSDDLKRWKKFKGNPVMPQDLLPKGFGPCWRDPYVWKEKKLWKMLIGSEKEKRGAILLYESRNLTQWAYQGCILNDTRKEVTECECPQLIAFDKSDALLFSCEPIMYWQTGKFENNSFKIKNKGLLDGGISFYAAKAVTVASKKILWGWLEEGRSAAEQKKAGWSGALSLPRELYLEKDRLYARPSRNLVTLRNKHARIKIPIETSAVLEIPPGIDVRACEILIAFKPKNSSRLKLHIYSNAKGKGGAIVEVDFSRHTLGSVEFSKANKGSDTHTLRLYVDHSIIEACINDQAWQTIRTYSKKNDDSIAIEHDGCAIQKIDIWSIKSIYE